jgi:hypothetical protein
MIGVLSMALTATLLMAGAPGPGGEWLGVPAPAETLYRDDGSPESYQSQGGYMCEFLPAPSSTPYPFDIIAVLWNTSLTNSFTLYIWDDDGSGGLPGTVLHTQVVNPPASGWFEITLSSPVQITSGQFYVGCATVQGIGFDETNPDYDFAYVDLGLGWDPFWYYGPHGDFLIRAVIEEPLLQNDVAVLEILAPDTLLNPYEPVDPSAMIQNLGTLPQDTIPVWCLIDSAGTGIYSDVDTVFGLASGDSSLVLFSTWTPDGGGNTYDVTVFTALGNDEDSTNDTLRKAVATRLHDCGVDTIVEPPDTVYINETYYPAAVIRNYGSETEDFDVTCEIGAFVDTFNVVSLGPGLARPCTFAVWQVPHLSDTSYTMTVTTMLTGDADSTNDTLSKSIYAYNPHDVGLIAIMSPPDTVGYMYYSVQAVIENFGEVTEDSVLVKSTITPDGYFDSAYVSGLAPAQTDTVNFQDWYPAPGMVAELCIYTAHQLDRDSTNDTLCSEIFKLQDGVYGIDSQTLPDRFRLYDASPNPCFVRTTIRYDVPSMERSGERAVLLQIYDSSGRLVRTLLEGSEKPGSWSATWNGRDESGELLPGGIYFSRLTAGDFTSSRKIVLLR